MIIYVRTGRFWEKYDEKMNDNVGQKEKACRYLYDFFYFSVFLVLKIQMAMKQQKNSAKEEDCCTKYNGIQDDC